jgi:hypothetical protein
MPKCHVLILLFTFICLFCLIGIYNNHQQQQPRLSLLLLPFPPLPVPKQLELELELSRRNNSSDSKSSSSSSSSSSLSSEMGKGKEERKNSMDVMLEGHFDIVQLNEHLGKCIREGDGQVDLDEYILTFQQLYK